VLRKRPCIVGLLRSGGGHRERADTYEALFEIGTQIQTEEASSERVFTLIVERARELLKTDVGWLGLVDASGRCVFVKVSAGTKRRVHVHGRSRSGRGSVALRFPKGVLSRFATMRVEPPKIAKSGDFQDIPDRYGETGT